MAPKSIIVTCANGVLLVDRVNLGVSGTGFMMIRWKTSRYCPELMLIAFQAQLISSEQHLERHQPSMVAPLTIHLLAIGEQFPEGDAEQSIIER